MLTTPSLPSIPNTISPMPTYPHIETYYQELEDIIQFGGSDNESSIRAAFQNCLSQYCANHRENLKLISELAGPGGIPDGTVKDTLRMARGYWEAKDTHDDLDAEIQAKFNRGYPRDNILFEDSETAVLFQNREEAMRVDMTDAAQLNRLILRFLNYELPNIEEFRAAQEQFKTDLPTVLENLRQSVEDAEANNPDYQQHAAEFLEQCRQSISPAVSEADVREMLLQHILTQDIFLRVFAEDQFHRENNIAAHLTALEQTFFTGDVRRQAIDRLRAYYGAIGRAADEIADYSEKQQFLKAIYEDFYKTYNPAAADRLGVVYTPNEIVDFIIRGTDHLLQKHFGRTLADDNVQILDPATGTGTFITSLIDYLPADRLKYKYLNEIHANEVAILPYYIANLNIEYSYREKTGEYLEFPNLCFVDTLDNMDWQQTGSTSGAVTRQGGFNLGGLSVDNWIRIQEQNEKPISVIIGNPPYNTAQTNFNEFNPNRAYPVIDQRIRETYSNASTAQNRNQQYDMYKRFIRWASDRLADDGIIAFVSNRAFLDSRQDDGFREVVADEFNELWAIDLKGNARTSGQRRRREGGNIFDDKIRVGVAIYFLVRKQGQTAFKVFYDAVDDYTKSNEKVQFILDRTLPSFGFSEIAPDERGLWLNQTDTDFRTLVPLAFRTKVRSRKSENANAVFSLYSNGIKTQRDEWVLDFDRSNLASKVKFFTNVYEKQRRRLSGTDFEDVDLGTAIKWDYDLRRHLQRGVPLTYSQDHTVESYYRPFTKKNLYFLPELIGRRYQMPKMFPNGYAHQNQMICIKGPTANYFVALASDRVVDVKFTETGDGPTFCLPLYRYMQEGDRVSNITEWGLLQVRGHYGDDDITAEDIFSYTYAVLHDPKYRETYAVDLLQEFPRLFLHDDFDAWTSLGQQLLDLHIGFESASPWKLNRVEQQKPSGNPRLRADKERGTITLDNQTTLTGIPDSAWEYRLGSRSALEWVLDQYKERKPRDPTIRERFNAYRFADHKEHVIDLLKRVTTVSAETVRITNQLAELSNIQPTQDQPSEPEMVTLSAPQSSPSKSSTPNPPRNPDSNQNSHRL